jgi:uracil DNA glycosylase
MPAKYGNFTHWAEQGVLLLNAALTVAPPNLSVTQKSAGLNSPMPSSKRFPI